MGLFTRWLPLLSWNQKYHSTKKTNGTALTTTISQCHSIMCVISQCRACDHFIHATNNNNSNNTICSIVTSDAAVTAPRLDYAIQILWWNDETETVVWNRLHCCRVLCQLATSNAHFAIIYNELVRKWVNLPMVAATGSGRHIQHIPLAANNCAIVTSHSNRYIIIYNLYHSKLTSIKLNCKY